jgi:hypothetical protein
MKTSAAVSVAAVVATTILAPLAARADLQINETVNQPRLKVWSVKEPVVTQADTSYGQITMSPGDQVKVTDAGGCVQTGGHGKTWKRYVDPSGDNSDHLYHGTIRLPGMSGAMRIGDFRNQNPGGYTVPANAGSDRSLHLGYEDDNYGDNGYWGHDDGTENQCKNSVNAFVVLQISTPAPRPTVSLVVQPTQVVAGSAYELALHAPAVAAHAAEPAVETPSAKPEAVQPGVHGGAIKPLPIKPIGPVHPVGPIRPGPVKPTPVKPVKLLSRVTLNWSSTNADSCQWSDAMTGSAPPNGSMGITSTGGPAGQLLAGSYHYVLTCTGAGGTAFADARLLVTPAPPAVSLSVTPTTIASGAQAQLTWTSSNANHCEAGGGELAWSGSEPLNGSQILTPAATGVHTYKLTCSGAGLTSTTATVQLTVTPPQPPTVNIAVNPASINRGSAATLSWSTANANNCLAGGGEQNWSGAQPLSGSLSVSPLLRGAHTYKLTCTGSGGSTTQTATLTVN